MYQYFWSCAWRITCLCLFFRPWRRLQHRDVQRPPSVRHSSWPSFRHLTSPRIDLPFPFFRYSGSLLICCCFSSECRCHYDSKDAAICFDVLSQCMWWSLSPEMLKYFVLMSFKAVSFSSQLIFLVVYFLRVNYCRVESEWWTLYYSLPYDYLWFGHLELTEKL